jgi:hypothetical protein
MINFKRWPEGTNYSYSHLYHVTPSCGAILKKGFIPASRLPEGSTVMGGSHQESVSFTYDLSLAKFYKVALEEVRDMFNDSDYMYSERMWNRLLKKFPLASNGNYLIGIAKSVLKEKTDEFEKMQFLFFMLPQIFGGHFPLMFGSGLRKRLFGNPDICILSDDVEGLDLELGQKNEKEKEVRVKNPEIITTDRISVVEV